MKSGRKPIYDVKSLEIGQKMELLGKAKKYKDQYLHNFKKSGYNLELLNEGKKIFVRRLS